MKLIKNPNEIIGKEYNPHTYHCYHFMEECLNVPRLEDVATDTVLDDVIKYKDMFMPIKEPIAYCVALLGDKHIGIYLNDGVYHNDTTGVRYERLRNIKRKYKTVSYYDIY